MRVKKRGAVLIVFLILVSIIVYGANGDSESTTPAAEKGSQEIDLDQFLNDITVGKREAAEAHDLTPTQEDEAVRRMPIDKKEDYLADPRADLGERAEIVKEVTEKQYDSPVESRSGDSLQDGFFFSKSGGEVDLNSFKGKSRSFKSTKQGLQVDGDTFHGFGTMLADQDGTLTVTGTLIPKVELSETSKANILGTVDEFNWGDAKMRFASNIITTGNAAKMGLVKLGKVYDHILNNGAGIELTSGETKTLKVNERVGSLIFNDAQFTNTKGIFKFNKNGLISTKSESISGSIENQFKFSPIGNGRTQIEYSNETNFNTTQSKIELNAYNITIRDKATFTIKEGKIHGCGLWNNGEGTIIGKTEDQALQFVIPDSYPEGYKLCVGFTKEEYDAHIDWFNNKFHIKKKFKFGFLHNNQYPPTYHSLDFDSNLLLTMDKDWKDSNFTLTSNHAETCIGYFCILEKFGDRLSKRQIKPSRILNANYTARNSMQEDIIFTGTKLSQTGINKIIRFGETQNEFWQIFKKLFKI